MAKKQFKAESKRLLDLMINSIYTHKEIFLREIISNASDAMRQAVLSGSDGRQRGADPEGLQDRPVCQTRTPGPSPLRDNGIGMDKEELENNLGVIASSGSYKFKQEVGDDAEDTDVIGQFGVGFYSAFMVCRSGHGPSPGNSAATPPISGSPPVRTATPSRNVTRPMRRHRRHHAPQGRHRGRSITASTWRNGQLQELVKKYSDYIRFPIRMAVTKHARRRAARRPTSRSTRYLCARWRR